MGTRHPITIGDNAWLGGGVIVCAGTTIGDNTVVGAGSVVTRDIPPGVLAAGNPARVIRELNR
jgi:maltose O-acetyltransferase